MNPATAFRVLVNDTLKALMEEADVWKTCLNCTAFDERTEHCGRAVPSARPPARVIAFGCDRFTDADNALPTSAPMPAQAPVTTIPPRPVVQQRPRMSFDDMDDDIPF